MLNTPDEALFNRATMLGKILQEKQMMVAAAESCTGGGIAQAITEVSGSSVWFDRGFVSYSNEAKQAMLGVRPETLEVYGAVSEQTAVEMAQGALQHSQADISVAVTGIAGPTGGSPDKPVGTVWIACARGDKTLADVYHFEGDRYAIRRSTVIAALDMLMKELAFHVLLPDHA